MTEGPLVMDKIGVVALELAPTVDGLTVATCEISTRSWNSDCRCIQSTAYISQGTDRVSGSSGVWDLSLIIIIIKVLPMPVEPIKRLSLFDPGIPSVRVKSMIRSKLPDIS